MYHLKQMGWLGLSAIALFASCADVDERGEAIESTGQSLSTSLDIDFEDYPTGALGSPWTVTTSGNATSTIVSTSEHGKALRVAHAGDRDYTFSQLAVTPTTPAMEFEFAVKPKNSASTFNVTLRGQKTSYSNPRFGLYLAPNSNEIRVSSAATAGNGHCGTIPYGRWSTIQWTLVPIADVTGFWQVDVHVNGVMTTACTGVSTKLRSALTLIIGDNQQASANTETLFDDLLLTYE